MDQIIESEYEDHHYLHPASDKLETLSERIQVIERTTQYWLDRVTYYNDPVTAKTILESVSKDLSWLREALND